MGLYVCDFHVIIPFMKLCYDRNSKDPTYFVQVGFRNGKKVTTKNIARIGKHSELLEKNDDPLAYAKAYVAQCNEEAKNTNKVGMEFNLDFAEKVMFLEKQVSESTLKNIGYLYLQHIYFMLGIDEFFSDKTKDSKVTFDPDCVNRFMTYLRILKPDSKLGSFENKDGFYEEPDFDYHHIMRTMDLLAENYNEYIEYLYKASKKTVKRNTAVCFYDCTNYYSEAVYQDEDYVDPVTGELLRGLRKYGVSKEHRPNPLVEMGLFMDTDGIPISMCIAPGSTNEHETVMPLERELIRMFKDKEKKFIYCADAGLGSYHIRNFNSMGGRAFIVTQSIKKLSDELKAQVFGDYGYRRLSDDSFISVKAMKEFDKTDKNNLPLYNDRAYKILIADTPVDVGLFEEKEYKNGKKVKVKSKTILRQYVIVTFSRKSFEYQRYVRNRQIERAKKLLEYMTPEDYRKGPNDITRFIKKQGNTKDKYELDVERIENEEKYVNIISGDAEKYCQL